MEKNEDVFLGTFKGKMKTVSAVPEGQGNTDRSTTGVAILFTSAFLAQGLEVREGTCRADTEKRWVSVEIVWNSQLYPVMSLYAAQEEREGL